MKTVQYIGKDELNQGFRAGFLDNSWSPDQVRELNDGEAIALNRAFPHLFKFPGTTVAEKAAPAPIENKAVKGPEKNK